MALCGYQLMDAGGMLGWEGYVYVDEKVLCMYDSGTSFLCAQYCINKSLLKWDVQRRPVKNASLIFCGFPEYVK
jgi:hypothetical protein